MSRTHGMKNSPAGRLALIKPKARRLRSRICPMRKTVSLCRQRSRASPEMNFTAGVTRQSSSACNSRSIKPFTFWPCRQFWKSETAAISYSTSDRLGGEFFSSDIMWWLGDWIRLILHQLPSPRKSLKKGKNYFGLYLLVGGRKTISDMESD